MDKRNDPTELEHLRRNSQVPINREKAETLKGQIKADKFIGQLELQCLLAIINYFNLFMFEECSAKTMENVKSVFEEAIRSVLHQNKPEEPSCFRRLFKSILFRRQC